MKTCTNCKHAEWKRTKSGNLHSSGEGRCKYPWKMPQLPASMYWGWPIAPTPCGGQISSKTGLKDHCAYYVREDE